MSLRIETPRLLLTELTESMTAEIQRQSLDVATRRFLPDEVFETYEEALATVQELTEAYGSPDGPYVYAVLCQGGALAGYVELCRIDDGWEIGYHMGEEHRGRGYAAESIAAFLPVMMDKLALDRVWGVVAEENAASCRVLEKCGFRLVERGEGMYHGSIRARRRYVFERA